MKFYYLKISFILLCWIFLSGYGAGVGLQAAGCALQVAAEVLPPVMKGIDNAITKTLSSVNEEVLKSDTPEVARVENNTEINDSTNISICKRAIQGNLPKWETQSFYQEDVLQAKKRGLSVENCSSLTGRFDESKISQKKSFDVAKIEQNMNNLKDKKTEIPCAGNYNSDWNNCVGIKINTNKSVYKGQWKNGKEHGTGTLTYSDGEKYVGGFKNGMHHGNGTITSPNGKVMRGIWENDKFKSEIK